MSEPAFKLPVLPARVDPLLAPKAAYMRLGADCAHCPLKYHRAVPTQRHPAPIAGGSPLPPIVALVGEAPGRREVQVGVPFSGPSGKVLNYACSQGGVDRRQLAVLNAIACGPIPSSSDIVKRAAMEACRPRLVAELRALRPSVVMAMGAVALRSLAPVNSSGVTALRGAKLDVADDIPSPSWRPRALFSTFHPAHVMRGGDGEADTDNKSVDALYYFILFDLAKTWRYAHGDAVEWAVEADLFADVEGKLRRIEVVDNIPKIAGPADGRELYDALGRVYDEARAHGEMTCDVETDSKDSLDANLTAIAYATPAGGLSATWNAWRLFGTVERLLAEIHGDRKLAWLWQNGIYDRIVLRRHKVLVDERHVPLTINGERQEDTLLMHHAAFPGLPHRLDSIATQFHVVTPWKNEYRTSVKDVADLIWYNCLHGSARVVLADGTTASISSLVNSRSRKRVLSMDRDGLVQAHRIVNWFKQRVPHQTWLRVKLAGSPSWGRGVVVTPDHKFYTRMRGQIRADELLADRDDAVYVDEAELSKEQLAAITGTLCGDSVLSWSPAFRQRRFEAPAVALRGGHTDRRLTAYKTRALAPHAVRLPPRPSRGFKSTSTTYSFRTRNLHQLAQQIVLHYDADGTRRLKDSTLWALGPIGWAWWFMDDGCRQKRPDGDTICLAACRYSREDAERAQAWLQKGFGRVYLSANKVLRFSREASLQFCAWMGMHVHPSARYKFPRGFKAPRFQSLKPTTAIRRSTQQKIVAVEPYMPPRGTYAQRNEAETRYCITVERNHNFFTSDGLVANCNDAVMQARLGPAIRKHIRYAKTERVYEADRQLNVVATDMRAYGCYVDAGEQTRHRATQTSRLEYMKEQLTTAFTSIEETWRQALARLMADKQRKTDPDSYLARVEIRYAEIAERTRKVTDIGMFKTKAKLDIVALFNVLKIPVKAFTKSGLPVTDKKAMEGAAARHPLMRSLIHIREAQHMISNFVDIKVRDSGRFHIDWKALDVDTPILTADGWKTMGTVVAGDSVFAPDGTLTAITYVSPIGEREGFRVVFDDHAEIVADAEHLWSVFKRQDAERQIEVVATRQLTRHVRMLRAAPLCGPARDLPIDPYVMGAWLGDGDRDNGLLFYAVADRDVPDEFERRGYCATAVAKDPRSNCKSSYYPRLYAELKRAGFMGAREIPEAYLLASREQRCELLKGLLDTDGSASLRGQVSFSTIHENLARQVLFLARSLGYRAGVCKSKVYVKGVEHGYQFQVFWEGWGPTFGMARKQARIQRSEPRNRAQHRLVTLIESVGARSVRCIAVDHPSHCYVVGRDLIVTHNTNKITGRWGGQFMNVPNNVSSWPPQKDDAGAFRINQHGDYVCKRDNLRSIIAAPTAAQVLEVAARDKRYVHPLVLARAKQGHGRMLVGADEDQVELRIVGFLSREPFLLKIFSDGRDPHSEFSRTVIFPEEFPKLETTIKEGGFKPKQTDLVEEQIKSLGERGDDIALAQRRKLEDILRAMAGWKRLRDLAKRIEYGSLYRGEAPTLWESVVKDFPQLALADVENMLTAVHEAMPRVVAWWNECDTYARQHREIRETWLNRVRFFPLGNFEPSIAVNFPVQARNAGLMATATFRFIALTRPELLDFEGLYRHRLLDAAWINARRDEGFAKWKAPINLILQVHDSLTSECDDEDAEKVAKLMPMCMHQVDTDERYGIKMEYTAEAKISRRWSKT